MSLAMSVHMYFLLPFQVSWFKKAQGPEGEDDLHVLTIGRETFSADTVIAFYISNQIQNSPPCSLMPETRFYAIKMWWDFSCSGTLCLTEDQTTGV